VGSEDRPSRDEALARCRQHVAVELAAFDRLGVPLELDQSEEITDWTLPWWLIPDWFVPVHPILVRAAVQRMEEIAVDIDRFLDGLAPGGLDRSSPGGWSIRRTLDHMAGGFDIGLRRLGHGHSIPRPGRRKLCKHSQGGSQSVRGAASRPSTAG